ncbi:MAG TPA: MBL fold metallo-hydrolase [Gemmatimonadales bacterium]|nr:MBL fold metallo-hydrolase [Gemmatimonadales bacterium]
MPLPSHHIPGGSFQNPWPGSQPLGATQLLRWFIERRTTRRPPPDPDPAVFGRMTPRLGQSPHGGIGITWIGHSTVLLEIGGLTVLTDPMWGDHASPVPMARLRRWVPVPLPLESLPRVDLVLLSHNHYDHLDAPTIRRLAALQPGIEWCVPLGLTATLRRLGVRHVHELDWWEEQSFGAARVAATPAQHFSARGPLDRNRTLWCGFVLRAGGRAVYFAGDTAYHPEFAAIGNRFGPFDLQLLPVGAYEPRWFMRIVHMNPEEAVRAYLEVGRGTARAADASVMVPIHWGTFKLTDEPMDEPPRRTLAAWRSAGLPGDALWVLQHGETRNLL